MTWPHRPGRLGVGEVPDLGARDGDTSGSALHREEASGFLSLRSQVTGHRSHWGHAWAVVTSKEMDNGWRVVGKAGNGGGCASVKRAWRIRGVGEILPSAAGEINNGKERDNTR